MKELAISEFERLIKTNHTVENITDVLSSMYDKGFEIGKLKKMFGSDYRSRVSFDMDDFIDVLFKKSQPKRISNERDLVYNGTEITSNTVLCVDFTIKQVIDMMKEDDSDYMYFERKNAEKKNFDLSIKRAKNDQEEIDFVTKDYNTLEVRIFLIKCYQVGYSEGEKSATEIPHFVRYVFETTKEIESYKTNKGISRSKKWDKKVSKGIVKTEIKTDKDLSDKEQYLTHLKALAPTWEEYKQYF